MITIKERMIGEYYIDINTIKNYTDFIDCVDNIGYFTTDFIPQNRPIDSIYYTISGTKEDIDKIHNFDGFNYHDGFLQSVGFVTFEIIEKNSIEKILSEALAEVPHLIPSILNTVKQHTRDKCEEVLKIVGSCARVEHIKREAFWSYEGETKTIVDKDSIFNAVDLDKI